MKGGPGRVRDAVGRAWTTVCVVGVVARRVPQEADEVVEIGYLNALFVVARAIGLVGHALDQKRLQQPLYRHPWEDVLYTS